MKHKNWQNTSASLLKTKKQKENIKRHKKPNPKNPTTNHPAPNQQKRQETKETFSTLPGFIQNFN